MQITARSEWMDDRKHAVVMSPGKDFQVVQTQTGTTVFFSIGTDQILYVSREAVTTSTGWNLVDLSSALSTQKVVVKSFCVQQNPDSLYFDLALVATIAGSDNLYLSLGNANTDDAWAKGVQWTAVPYDAASRDSPSLEISDVHLATLPSPGHPPGSQTCFVDVLQGTPQTNPMRLLDRYFIAPNTFPHWKKQNLSIDLAAGSIASCVGKRAKDRVGGMYTFGTIQDTREIIYTPAFNFFKPDAPAAPARLGTPDGTTAIASAMDAAGHTNLFVSAAQGVFVFMSDAQNDGAVGQNIITDSLFAGTSELSAQTMGKITALYGVNKQGDLIYSTCAAGSEASSQAWSQPVPLLSQIQRYAFFVSKQNDNNTLFAHTQGQAVTQLTQDPVTGSWASRSILLPSTNIDDVVPFTAFTTRLMVQGDAGSPAALTRVSLKATSPVEAYVNDVYCVLDPNVAVETLTDRGGVVNITQPTQDSVAICYLATLTDNSSVSSHIDPAEKAKNKLAQINSKEDLDKAVVPLADGTTRPLVSADIQDGEREAAAAAIKHLMTVASTLPPDGSPQGPSKAPADSAPAQQILHVNTDQGRGPARISLSDTVVGSVKSILVRAGDLFCSILRSAWHVVKSFVIQVVDGVHQVLVHIGDAIYRAILDCTAAIAHAAEWVFSKIKVAYEDLKAFLGFLFCWKDIVRTHKVVKNVITQYANYSISRITDVQTLTTTTFDSLEDKLQAWAGIPDHPHAVGQLSDTQTSSHESLHDPQTHYMNDKFKSNVNDAHTSAAPVDSGESGWTGVLSELLSLVTNEKDAIVNTIDQLKTQIIEPFASLTITEVIKRLIGILGGLVLETAKNIIVTTLGVARDLSKAVIEELNKPISIPVISSLYKEIADEDLSIMDVVCLVAAVPATIIFKAVTGSNPFPDNDSTNTLIRASDFATIQQAMSADVGLYRNFSVVSEFAAMAGLGLSVIANLFSLPWVEEGEPHERPGLIKQVSIPIRLLAIMPNLIRPRSDSDPWEDKMDSVVTDIAFAKVCLDATKIGGQKAYGSISPYIDYAISAVWIVPSVGRIVTSHSKSSAYTSLATSLAYDVTVMTNPIVWNPDVDAEVKTIVFAAANVVVALAAVVAGVTGGLLHDGD